jgi:F0F1-type ATP synthase assembly protein I
MLVPILLCTLLGTYLGERLDKPFLAVPLFVIGAVAGFQNVYKLAKKTLLEDRDEGNAKKNQ